MSGLRIPVVTGLGHATGTSTVAAVLHGRDAGAWAPAADVVVCWSGGESLRAAEGLGLAPFGRRPVLVVTDPGAAPAASRARLRRLADRFAGVVVLPHVPRWQVLATSFLDATELMALPREQLPPAQQAYATAVQQLVAVVLATGQLAEPVPPALIRRAPPGSPSPGPPLRAVPAAEPDGRLRAALVAARHPALRGLDEPSEQAG